MKIKIYKNQFLVKLTEISINDEDNHNYLNHRGVIFSFCFSFFIDI